MKKVQIKDSERWLILFIVISSLVFLLFPFLFNKSGVLKYSYFEYGAPILISILLIFLVAVSLFIILSINSEIKKEKKISKKFGAKDLKNFFIFCLKYDNFRALLYFNLFIIFLNAFLSTLFTRSGQEAIGAVFAVCFSLINSVVVSFLILLGIIMITREIKESIILKIILLVLIILFPIIISFFFIRLCLLILF